jgi:hypothetical protein
MKSRVAYMALAVLTLWVAYTCVSIELQNARAGYYLPRRDGGADGAWRLSPNNTPRDQLHGLIQTIGLLQYLLAPLLVCAATYILSRRSPATFRWIAVLGIAVGLVALGLAFYRGYLHSLGD